MGERGHERALEVGDGSTGDPDVLTPVMPVDPLEVDAGRVRGVEEGLLLGHLQRMAPGDLGERPIDVHTGQGEAVAAAVRGPQHRVTLLVSAGARLRRRCRQEPSIVAIVATMMTSFPNLRIAPVSL